MKSQTFEPKPVRDVIDQVFLSPRVLDKAAFDEFASIVKQLIEHASEATRSLQTSAAQAEAVHKRLAESAPVIESRLTGAGAAITTLDARTAEVRAALNKAAECAIRAETAQAATEQRTSEIMSQLESRIAGITKNGHDAMENARAAVEFRARETAETALRAIEAAGHRLEDLEAQSAARLTALVERTAQSIQELEDRLNQLTGRIATLTGAGLSAVASLCDRATAILGYDPSASEPGTPTAGSLTDLVRRAESSSPGAAGPARWCAQPESFDPTEPCIAERDHAPAPRAKRASGTPKRAKAARPAPSRSKSGCAGRRK